MSTRTTLLNLFKLVEHGIISRGQFTLFIYYKLYDNQPVSLSAARQSTGLSNTAINQAIKIFELMGIISVQRTPGKSNKIKTLSLSDLDTMSLLNNSIIISKIESYRDLNVRKYHKKSQVYSPDAFADSEAASQLLAIYKALPRGTEFRVTPQSERNVIKLSKSFDIGQYAKWFVSNKLYKTVNSFSLGIFCYDGILAEFRAYIKSRAKTSKYKDVRSKQKKFAQAAQQFEKEFE